MLISTGSAVFSPDGVYRYLLERDLGGMRPLVIVGLNPSIANAEDPDNTITKECGFARRWEFVGRLVKVNAYGFVETKPKAMKAHAKAGGDVLGVGGQVYPEDHPSTLAGLIDLGNDYHVMRAVDRAIQYQGIVLVAWGQNIDPQRQRELAKMLTSTGLTDLWCLGTNGDGSPKHPLYLPYSTPRELWTCP